ncbi:MAG: YciI family protein [Chitinophagaceae bacterium]
MKEFLMVYRADYNAMPKVSPEEMQANTQKWMDWVAGIAAQGKLADRGNRLFPAGKVLKGNNVVSDGPYTEIKESIMGYSLLKVASIEEAVELAKGCPIFKMGGNVEVREINAMD